ncbi:MAG TPA: ester cyclase [Polyangiaceae bacterium]
MLALVACGEDTPAPQAPPPPPPPPATAAATPPPPADTTPPPPPKPSMADMQTASLKTVTDALNAHDAQKYASAFATDGVGKQPGMPDNVGRDAIAADIQRVFTAFPDLKFAFSRAMWKGNVGVTTWDWTGTDSGGFMGAKPTGRPVGLSGATVAVFGDDGLIKELHVYQDFGTLMQQLDPKAKKGSFRAPPTLATQIETVSAGGPDEDKNLGVAKGMYQSFDDHKAKDVCGNGSADMVLDDMTGPGPIKGTKGCSDYLGGMFKGIPDVHQLPLANQWAIGPYTVSEGVTQGTHKGQLGPFKASGKTVAMHFVDIGSVSGGKYTHYWSYANGVELLTQIGVIKPPPAATAQK